jgi:glutamine synthetase
MELSLINELSNINVQLFGSINKLAEDIKKADATAGIEKQAKIYRSEVFSLMQNIRHLADRAECIVARELWPYPAYGDLLFKI